MVDYIAEEEEYLLQSSFIDFVESLATHATRCRAAIEMKVCMQINVVSKNVLLYILDA